VVLRTGRAMRTYSPAADEASPSINFSSLTNCKDRSPCCAHRHSIASKRSRTSVDAHSRPATSPSTPGRRIAWTPKGCKLRKPSNQSHPKQCSGIKCDLVKIRRRGIGQRNKHELALVPPWIPASSNKRSTECLATVDNNTRSMGTRQKIAPPSGGARSECGSE